MARHAPATIPQAPATTLPPRSAAIDSERGASFVRVSGVLENLAALLDQHSLALPSVVKVPPWQRPSSAVAPAPRQGALGGSGQLGTLPGRASATRMLPATASQLLERAGSSSRRCRCRCSCRWELQPGLARQWQPPPEVEAEP